MQIISLGKNQTMSSREIADLTDKRHDNVMAVIRDLIIGGVLTSEIQELDYSHRGNTYKFFSLNKRDSIVVVARLNPKFMAAIVDRWDELEQKELNRIKHSSTRQDSKLEYKPMTDAIALAHEEIKPYHFSNEADLINRIVLGMTASKFKKHHDVEKGELIRDYMTTEQLNCIVSLQRANTVYIEDGLDFQERKQKLTDLFNRKHKQTLIDEIHLLEA